MLVFRSVCNITIMKRVAINMNNKECLEEGERGIIITLKMCERKVTGSRPPFYPLAWFI